MNVLDGLQGCRQTGRIDKFSTNSSFGKCFSGNELHLIATLRGNCAGSGSEVHALSNKDNFRLIRWGDERDVSIFCRVFHSSSNVITKYYLEPLHTECIVIKVSKNHFLRCSAYLMIHIFSHLRNHLHQVLPLLFLDTEPFRFLGSIELIRRLRDR